MTKLASASSEDGAVLTVHNGGKSAREDRPLRLRSSEVSDLLDALARALRPIYPLQTDNRFDELLRALSTSANGNTDLTASSQAVGAEMGFATFL